MPSSGQAAAIWASRPGSGRRNPSAPRADGGSAELAELFREAGAKSVNVALPDGTKAASATPAGDAQVTHLVLDDVRPLAQGDPVGRGQLAGRLERPAGRQREQDPLDAAGLDAPAGQPPRGWPRRCPAVATGRRGPRRRHRPGVVKATSAEPAGAAAADGSSSLANAAASHATAGRPSSSSRPNERCAFVRETRPSRPLVVSQPRPVAPAMAWRRLRQLDQARPSVSRVGRRFRLAAS
jgi:hypothetical protein